MTSEQVTGVFKQMADYRHANFGLPNGPDYPAIAQAVTGSEHFQVKVLLAVMSAALCKPPKDAAPGDEAVAKEMLTEWAIRNPVAIELLEMFYAGYRLGIAEGERKQLEDLATR